jgi:hypothetical protein
VIEDSKNEYLSYPLKCYVTLQNLSSECADIRLSDYKPNTVTLKRLSLDVLQVKLREWYPTQHGVDRVAVLPMQQFQAWVGIDERKYNKQQLDSLIGKIGDLVFIVNNIPVTIVL